MVRGGRGPRQIVEDSCHNGVMSLVLILAAAVSPVVNAAPVDYEKQSIRIAMTQEPPSLNSLQTTDIVSYFVLGHITEGLLRYDRRGKLAPGVARSWKVEPDRMTFELRDDARWHDGTAVTAHDFVYAWRRVNDPIEASPFGAIMYPIKNAEAIQKGELPVEALGIRAVGDFKLVVELERSCGFCLNLMPHGTFLPVKEAFHREKGGRFAADADDLLSNGPFVLSQWVHESRLVMQKNPYYWNHEAITLNEIEVAYITSDNRTRLNLFRDDQIAFARLGAETARDAASQGMRMRTFLTGGVAYIWFNMREGRPTRNKKLRQAVQASFDSAGSVNHVIAIPGYRPTNTLFPSWFRGMEKSFLEEYPPPVVARGLSVAKKLLADARAGLGEIPQLTILTVSSPTGSRAAEFFQGMLRQSLGLDALVDQQSFKQYLNKARAGEFDLVLSSWYPDFDDLLTYADLLGSDNPNNRGRFRSQEYDRWLDVLIGSLDPFERFNAAAEMQRILVEDVPVLPTAETSSAYLLHPKLKGVVRRVVGHDPDFTFARVLP